VRIVEEGVQLLGGVALLSVELSGNDYVEDHDLVATPASPKGGQSLA
jgi:hypothetical protein